MAKKHVGLTPRRSPQTHFHAATFCLSFGVGREGNNVFISAEKRCRICSRHTTPRLVTQLNWITRRGPAKDLCPWNELSLRRNASNVPSRGGTSATTSSMSVADRNSRNRPPCDSHVGFI